MSRACLRLPVAAVRAGRRGSVSGERAGESGAARHGARQRRSAGSQISRVRAGLPCAAQGPCADLRRDSRRRLAAALAVRLVLLPVVEFLQQAARDPLVVAIKQTVYRVGCAVGDDGAADPGREQRQGRHRGRRAARALRRGSHIIWAQRLEDAGAHVVYGVVGHKTHAKMAMVVRREEDGMRRYVHLGTGNYHSRTARLYTDFGLADVSRRDLQRRERRVHAADWARQGDQAEASVAGAVHHAHAHETRDPERDEGSEGRAQGADHRAHECAARAGNHRCAI